MRCFKNIPRYLILRSYSTEIHKNQLSSSSPSSTSDPSRIDTLKQNLVNGPTLDDFILAKGMQ